MLTVSPLQRGVVGCFSQRLVCAGLMAGCRRESYAYAPRHAPTAEPGDGFYAAADFNDNLPAEHLPTTGKIRATVLPPGWHGSESGRSTFPIVKLLKQWRKRIQPVLPKNFASFVIFFKIILDEILRDAL